MAAAVVRGGTEILSSVVRGQVEIHEPYGGVVPELASRDHVRSVSAVVEAALAQAGVRSHELCAIAVTAGPGLIGSLLVGLSFGKALAYRLGVPMVGVHHLSGHLASAELADASLRAPYLGLLTSGGHTALFRIEADALSAASRRDPRRRGRRGVRQGRQIARARFSGRAGGLGGRASWRFDCGSLPATDARPRRPRFFVQRIEDRGRVGGRAPSGTMAHSGHRTSPTSRHRSKRPRSRFS